MNKKSTNLNKLSYLCHEKFIHQGLHIAGAASEGVFEDGFDFALWDSWTRIFLLSFLCNTMAWDAIVVLLEGEGGGDGIGTQTTAGIFPVVKLTGDVGSGVVEFGKMNVGGWELTWVLPW